MRSPVNLSDTSVRFSIQTEGRLHFSAPRDPAAYAVLALHGYGQSPEMLLPLVRRMVGVDPAVAALAAPFPMYDRLAADGQTVYNWGTRHHWDEAIRIHHDLVHQSLVWLGREAGFAANRMILLGFSQPVGLNYRFCGTNPNAVRGVIGICGGVPSRWETGPNQPLTTAILHIARSEDEVYPREQVEHFPERLRHHAKDVEFHLIPGGHRFPSQAGPIAETWLRRVGLKP